MDWAGLFSWFEKLPSLSFSAVVVVGTLLLLGDSPTAWLGLTEYRAWVSFAFIAALTVFLSQIVYAAWRWATRQIANHRRTAARNSRLHDLPPDEKFVVAKFLQKNSRTVAVDTALHAVATLEKAGIISRSGGIAYSDDCPYILAEWAWQYLRKNENILKPYPPAPQQRKRA